MSKIVERALPLWNMAGARYRLIADRENAVYQVSTKNAVVALRIHRQAYRTDQELWSELQWMAAISAGGITVPAPIPSTSNDFLHIVDGVQVDVLTWLSGMPVGDKLVTLNAEERTELFYGIGRDMARLHEISDTWAQPNGFTRCAWDRDGLLGEAPHWDRFWDSPTLSSADRQLFLNLRYRATDELARIEGELDYGLIHADLVHSNVLVDGNNLQLIDFDDGGFGFRIFDVATALLKNQGESDYPEIKAALIDGYFSVRTIDLAALDLFLLLRSASYLGWNITRMHEAGAVKRNERFISTTRRLTQDYMR